MGPAAQRAKKKLLSGAASMVYHSGLLRGLNLAANRLESTAAGDGSGGFPFIRRRRGGNVQILVYHRVTDSPDEFLPALSVEAFSRQMEFVARSCHGISLAEAVDALENDTVPDNAVVVTFDDGYHDNYARAFPILKSLAIPATVFLCTGPIGTGGLIWHDRVFRAFSQSTATRFEAHRIDEPQGRAAARKAVLSELRTLDSERRVHRIDEIVSALDVVEENLPRRLMMNWDEAGELARNGIELGAHTVTHPILSRVSVDQARSEISGSRQEIEAKTGARVTAFAYPNGKPQDYDDSTKGLLRELGFRCAVTTRFGTNQVDPSGRWDPFELRRGGPTDGDTAMFAAKLNLYKLTT